MQGRSVQSCVHACMCVAAGGDGTAKPRLCFLLTVAIAVGFDVLAFLGKWLRLRAARYGDE